MLIKLFKGNDADQWCECEDEDQDMNDRFRGI